MAELKPFTDSSVPPDPIYWVKAFGISFSFQDDASGAGVTIAYGFKEAGASPSGQAARVLTQAEKANIRDAILKVQAYADITFVEVAPGVANIVFAAGPQDNTAFGRTFFGGVGSQVEV